MIRLAAAFAFFVALGSIALAFEPNEVLEDPTLEARARAITQELRCLVCQNESIDASNAPLAKDLRQLVRARLLAGDTDQEAIDYVVARYGTYVLLRPPISPLTYLLWFGPLVVLAIGGAIAWREIVRARGSGAAGGTPRAPESGLTQEEELRLVERRQANREAESTAPHERGAASP
ncbi:MAG: cytochrome c-type biogenesis protein CcmH [Alphaproteobacteria bacterium]|nr:cytochrome c-type biogenesis protein CcmH [Alphaproteobacteria bacterium]